MEKKIVTVGNITVGDGLPKICVPLVAVNDDELVKNLELVTQSPCDLIEFRADFYDGITEEGVLEQVLETINRRRGYIPLLFTFRTKEEGGNCVIDEEAYAALAVRAAETGMVDLVDVECCRNEQSAKKLIAELHACGVPVIGSNHDFFRTPGRSEIVRRLVCMQQMDADITKLAVMPETKADVLELLAAAVEMDETAGDRPCVTMSMGSMGMISRVAGSFSGSAITFGSAGRTSAPGQPDAASLRMILQTLFQNVE